MDLISKKTATISATEAKSATLDDLDIRSSYTGFQNPATWTGTDNVLVVGGEGVSIDASGGHTKMGELIARAVYDAVKEAVYKQNGFNEGRTVFQRLKERKTSVREIGAILERKVPGIGLKLEQLLLDPQYSSFIESAMSISDDYERYLIEDFESFDLLCNSIAAQLAGRTVRWTEVPVDGMPIVLRKAFGSLAGGLGWERKKKKE